MIDGQVGDPWSRAAILAGVAIPLDNVPMRKDLPRSRMGRRLGEDCDLRYRERLRHAVDEGTFRNGRKIGPRLQIVELEGIRRNKLGAAPTDQKKGPPHRGRTNGTPGSVEYESWSREKHFSFPLHLIL